MCKILYRELQKWNPLLIIGETSQKDRQKIIKFFNEDDIHRILVCSDAAEYGVNLQRASVIVHYDQAWSISKMTQREGRAHRIGQKQSVLVVTLLAKSTMDMYVRRVLHAKRGLSNALFGDAPMTLTDVRGMLNDNKER